MPELLAPQAQGYFQILTDTLLADIIQPMSLKFKIKEVDHPKLYFFDTGVIRTLQNLVHDPLESSDRGILLETYFLDELKSFNKYKKVGGEFHYWGTQTGQEVDFIFSRGRKNIGFEIKSNRQLKSEYSKTLKQLLEAKKLSRAFGIYCGKEILNDSGIMVYPIDVFPKELYTEKLQLF
jgi:predicted AAA+ superfamily ATPase